LFEQGFYVSAKIGLLVFSCKSVQNDGYRSAISAVVAECLRPAFANGHTYLAAIMRSPSSKITAIRDGGQGPLPPVVYLLEIQERFSGRNVAPAHDHQVCQLLAPGLQT
jgi:hypothetical protein